MEMQRSDLSVPRWAAPKANHLVVLLAGSWEQRKDKLQAAQMAD